MRILYVTHGHPALQPGGAEIFAHDLFSIIRERSGIRGLFLACTGEPQRAPRPGTLFQTVGRSADEMLIWTGPSDLFNLSQGAPEATMAELEQLFCEFKPDIVHFHHYVSIGIEALALARRCLSDAGLVLTLHDYYAVCAHDGLMVTPADMTLCSAASPGACHRCFPERKPEQFMLRRLNLLAHFELVDRFLAPSKFLARRYAAWGLPEERIQLVANGRPAAACAPRPAGRRNAFAFFGNLSEAKGILVALEAARLLAAEGSDFTLDIFGGTPGQDDAFRAKLDAAVAAAGPSVHRHGAYAAADVPRHLHGVDWVVVPSIWWENAPLVIIEALIHGRVVICSDIGGMAELVADGVSGLHFRAGDARSLAGAMRRAMDTAGLWERLASGLSPAARAGMTIEAAADRHLALYRELMAAKRDKRPPRQDGSAGHEVAVVHHGEQTEGEQGHDG
jgi:glycosyltransferase involved in cell wall biosynthesis